jgi:AP-1-like transcription factor
VDVDLHGRGISYDSFDGADGKRLLAAGAAWDLIQRHELYRRGMVDIAEVIRRLKGKAACDGRGPAFKEAEVIRAIEESAQSGSDELI